MTFLMSNGAPATFATREDAAVLLRTKEIQEIPYRDLSARDWAAAEAAGIMIDYCEEFEVPCFAVAC